ncbi:MAG: type II toxin-antitoxin system RelE/ParE family toxin [Verrucomicrobia bacterium]|nr:type II toxin-antitoxin system RelE/ParE family toxin [Verrucomicrobiota bacterium]
MRKTESLKPILWIGSSKKDLKAMPEAVIKEFGHALREIQKGRDPGNTKPLKHLPESGVSEILVNEREGTFRTIYTVAFKDAIAVLHVFQKKSKTGIATPKKDLDLILQRLRIAKTEYKAWQEEI